MSVELKGLPRDPCRYTPDKEKPGIYYTDCGDHWIVPQDNAIFCTFCGRPIEKNPPQVEKEEPCNSAA